MSEGRISVEELRAGLHPLRMPEAGAGGWIADMFAAAGLALLLALIVASLLGALATRRRRSGRSEPSLKDRFEDATGLAPDAARLEVYRLVKSHAPSKAKEFEGALFDPKLPFDFEEAEAAVFGRDGHT